jgi:hypothetical protein
MIYNHKGYELEITYNSETRQYEGSCSELGIKLSSSRQDLLESCFRERVDEYLGSFLSN